jgi:hypothetical protein
VDGRSLCTRRSAQLQLTTPDISWTCRDPLGTARPSGNPNSLKRTLVSLAALRSLIVPPALPCMDTWFLVVASVGVCVVMFVLLFAILS